MLKGNEYLNVIKKTALTSVDLILEYNDKILLGYRNNNPAKNFWFTPGCSTYKLEKQNEALKRLGKTELNLDLNFEKCKLVGVYDHIYDNNFYSNEFETHYVNTCYYLKINKKIIIKNDSQHDKFKWFSIEEIKKSEEVHDNVKLFLPNLIKLRN